MPELNHLLTAFTAIAGVGGLLVIVQALPAKLAQTLEPPQSGGVARAVPLDGLRALLALGVVFQHAWIYRDYFAGRPLVLPDNPYFGLSGSLAVPLFFMITGFLFWNKAIAARGRLRVIPLYLSRARRILPLYYFFCACVLLTILAVSPGWSAGTLGRELLSLIVPGRCLSGPLLGVDRSMLMGHAWTLYYEIGFYLLLPVLGFAARTRPLARVFVAVVFVLLATKRLVTGITDYPLLSFLAGIGTAEFLIQVPGAGSRLRTPVLGVAILAAILVLPPLAGSKLTPLAFGCGAGAFATIAAGNDLLGLLTLRATCLIGHVSYSIYLLHTVVLYLGLGALNRFVPIAGLAPAAYCAVVAVMAGLVVGLCMLTYRFIEKPWLVRGRKPAGSVRRDSAVTIDRPPAAAP